MLFFFVNINHSTSVPFVYDKISKDVSQFGGEVELVEKGLLVAFMGKLEHSWSSLVSLCGF